MKVCMFPGQGSQSRGMGAKLFDRWPELVAQADAVLGYSIRELCLQDPHRQLGDTRYTQPALYVVNALAWFDRLQRGAAPPDALMGHSLGEFDALMAAGCFDFETGLKLVRRRGELMGRVQGGAMAAILNASREEIEQALRSHGLTQVALANYNTPAQIVISGLAAEVAQAEALFSKGRTRFYPLATSGAFHSAFMSEAMREFGDYLAGFELAPPRVPVIANATARPYAAGAVRETLTRQIASAVRWCDSVQHLLALGDRNGQAVEFEELGHGDVLTRLVQTIRAQTPAASLPAHLDAAQDAAEAAVEHAVEDVADGAADGAEVTASPAAKVTPAAAPSPAVPPPTPGDARPLATARLAAARQQVEAWNRAHAPGARFRSSMPDYPELQTRTGAVVLFGHRAAVYMQGYDGYFALDELTPA